MNEGLLHVAALTTTDQSVDDPTEATQYCVLLPNGVRAAYGDQSWVKYGGPLRDHPEGRIERRSVTITYGEWEPTDA